MGLRKALEPTAAEAGRKGDLTERAPNLETERKRVKKGLQEGPLEWQLGLGWQRPGRCCNIGEVWIIFNKRLRNRYRLAGQQGDKLKGIGDGLPPGAIVRDDEGDLALLSDVPGVLNPRF